MYTTDPTIDPDPQMIAGVSLRGRSFPEGRGTQAAPCRRGGTTPPPPFIGASPPFTPSGGATPLDQEVPEERRREAAPRRPRGATSPLSPSQEVLPL